MAINLENLEESNPETVPDFHCFTDFILLSLLEDLYVLFIVKYVLGGLTRRDFISFFEYQKAIQPGTTVEYRRLQFHAIAILYVSRLL